jgi:hypothetical protein
MAEHVPTTSTPAHGRRHLLSAAPAVMVLAGIGGAVQAAAPGPDAELIALCAQLDALEHEFLATDFDAMPNTPAGDHAEAEQDRIADAQAPIVDAICARPPQTPSGAVVVAHSLALADADLFRRGGPDGYPNDRLIAALVRGLTGRAAT